VELDPQCGVWRRAKLEPILREEQYEGRTDYFTLFYDVFWSSKGTEVFAIGPSFPNQLNIGHDLTIVALPSGHICPFQRIGKMGIGTQLAIAPPEGTQGLTFTLAEQQWTVAIQPNLSSLLAGCRALITLSRNNRLEWIRDWATFHAAEYGVDTVVLFDNASTAYQVKDIEAVLRPIPGIQHILVVHQPCPYGSGKYSELPLQHGMLALARRRLLASAEWMLNLDIDELLMLEEGVDLGTLIDRSEPVTSFSRLNVANEPDPNLPGPVRHRQFWRMPPDAQSILPKWLAKPERLPEAAVLRQHDILEASTWSCPMERGFIAHFQSITSGWKNAKRLEAQSGKRHWVEHEVLHRRLARVFNHESPDMNRPVRPWSPLDSNDADLMLRDAARLIDAEHPAEAAPLIEQALTQAPDAVSGWLLRKQAAEWLSMPERVRESQARIDALTRLNPAWHLARARKVPPRNPRAALAITRAALAAGISSEELIAFHCTLGGDPPDPASSQATLQIPPVAESDEAITCLRTPDRLRDFLYPESPYLNFPMDEHPSDRQGWGSSKPVFRTLIERHRPRRVIEVGSWKGASAIHIGRICRQLHVPCQEIVCVDTWLGSNEMWLGAGAKAGPSADTYASLRIRNGYPRLIGTFMRNIIDSDLTDLVTPLPLPSTAAARLLTAVGITADLIYIDGAHDSESVLLDLRAWWPILEPGGVLLGDDFTRKSVRVAAERWATEVSRGLTPADNKFYVVK